jgi:hypothetical protein
MRGSLIGNPEPNLKIAYEEYVCKEPALWARRTTTAPARFSRPGGLGKKARCERIQRLVIGQQFRAVSGFEHSVR